jgi:hypothetical protein
LGFILAADLWSSPVLKLSHDFQVRGEGRAGEGPGKGRGRAGEGRTVGGQEGRTDLNENEDGVHGLKAQPSARNHE